MNKLAFLKTNLSFLILLFVLVSSCAKEDNYAEKDDKLIREYLEKKDIQAMKTASGLYYTITVPGSDEKPDLTSKVTVHYKGYFLNDEEFESSYSGSAPTFPLANVIQGWREGLQLFGKGGKGTLYIPSGLAYGSTAMAGVPANSVLIFDIHLINIK
ncbi:MAG: FKBP-type peptidyl-prolyl cis-trans isomerase [Lentimicrobiaceae bacterium]|nr:FKBP-type peptidyl-prolyl cis-trans isomerase [Lentimicrobiaceae bacterium]MCO5265178.1 FKBP-type peptidyl-prolyl cis-trans isomerase [Lentimicrobium sp.]HPG32723.1 FKBP-type peptidyl-prolyl cis-trans isomerase [Lentimicrobium sp.]